MGGEEPAPGLDNHLWVDWAGWTQWVGILGTERPTTHPHPNLHPQAAQLAASDEAKRGRQHSRAKSNRASHRQRPAHAAPGATGESRQAGKREASQDEQNWAGLAAAASGKEQERRASASTAAHARLSQAKYPSFAKRRAAGARARRRCGRRGAERSRAER